MSRNKAKSKQTRREFITALGAGAVAGSAPFIFGTPAYADVRAGFTRIAGSFDGNRDDKDDWVSVYMSLAILGRANLQSRLVHLHINCNFVHPSIDSYEQQMRDAAVKGRDQWGHTVTIYDPQLDFRATVEDFANQINASGSNNKLAILAAGPMHVIYHALAMSNPLAHLNTGILSHSTGYNDTEGTLDLERIKRDFPHMRERIYHLPNQNNKLNTGQNFAPWGWMPGSSVDYGYRQMRKINKGDCSDSGMYYFAVTGVHAPTPANYRAFFGR